MWSGSLQSPDTVVGTGGTTLSTTLRLNLTLASTQLIKQLHFHNNNITHRKRPYLPFTHGTCLVSQCRVLLYDTQTG